MKNEGMPISKQPGSKGNLRIRFDLVFPRRQVTDPGQADELRRILEDKY